MQSRPPFIEEPAGLASYVTSLAAGTIAFDGRPGSGKNHVARRLARQLGCTFVDVDHFVVSKQGMFVGALRVDDLRSAIEAATARPVLLATVCARHVVERLGLPVAAMIWVEPAGSGRIEQIRRYFDYDDNNDAGHRHPLYREVEAYIAATDARHTPDAIYLNVRD